MTGQMTTDHCTFVDTRYLLAVVLDVLRHNLKQHITNVADVEPSPLWEC